MNKELERVLQRLHGEYQYDPSVSEERKKWWFDICRMYLVNYITMYAKFEPEIVEFVYL